MQMRARVVDWALLALITVELVSGLYSFTVGRPRGRLVFLLHGWLGLAIIFLIFFKLRRVRRRVMEPRRWQRSTLVSILLSLSALAAVGTGFIWTSFQWPIGYPNGMILHTTFGIVLLILSVWHMRLRYKPLKRHDIADRRTALTGMAVLAGGGLAWLAQDRSVKTLALPGADRRFTGSRNAGDGEGNGAFPVTMWMLDRPAPLDLAQFQLTVSGLVNRSGQYPLAQLASFPQLEIKEIIDCTGGWYSAQRWSGIPVADLLDRAGVAPAARHVGFISSTGYRWSLPVEEARDVLLASHVGGERLSHGHGAPLRLVAPGRRGFQWVKWVVEVQVMDEMDWGQWQAIFTSGLNRSLE